MVEEEHGVLLVVLHPQGVTEAAGVLGDGLAAENLEAGATGGDGEGEDHAGVGAADEGGGEGDVALVADGGGGGELLASGDDDSLVGLLDDVEGEFFFKG